MSKETEQWLREIKDRITGILHVGAHTGQEAEFYDSIGVKNVIWIEANPELIPRLKANVEPYGHRVIQALVLSGPVGEPMPFYISSNDGESSSYLDFQEHTQHYPDITMVKTIELDTTSLDCLFPNGELKGFNLWVLDVQGCEAALLFGACRSIAFADYVLTEIDFGSLYECGTRPRQIDKELIDFTCDGLWRTPYQYGWGEALYRRFRIGAVDLSRRIG